MPTAVVIDASGVVAMIVHADKPEQLDDRAANPIGCTQVRVDRKQYDACRSLTAVADLAVASYAKLATRAEADVLTAKVESAKALKLQTDAQNAAWSRQHAIALEEAKQAGDTKRLEELLAADQPKAKP